MPTISADRAYAPTYRNATRRSQVYRNFAHQFSVNATHLSAKFLEAFQTRHQLLSDSNHHIFPDTNDNKQVAFLVSMESPSYINLQEWTVQLHDDGNKSLPVAIKKISNKHQLELFFHKISPWSKEYLLVFPSAEKFPLRLVLGNAKAKVTLRWED